MQMIKKIKQIKKRRGVSYEKIAHEMGDSWSTVQRWLSGTNLPHKHTIPLIEAWIAKN